MLSTVFPGFQIAQKDYHQPVAPEPASTQQPTQTIAVYAALNAQTPSPSAGTGYAQILAQIPPTVAAAQPSHAWALHQHVAMVPVQIWQLLTTVDLARQVHVLASIRLAARGHVLILILTLTTAVLVPLCHVVEHSLVVALGSVQTCLPVCSIVDPAPLHRVRACCRLVVVGGVLI
ncbi:hypothetical protein PENPOL_c003G09898 [Penicillium polonicum]|uniref:Uncharacterized protein n=1 Tax=Penicillium polonicum TaxID=60169 RepID=A0A1V6NTK7_PENPO|nr:hypothetical protein PENPOL_c003G09898 [Penicillium polonicum]